MKPARRCPVTLQWAAGFSSWRHAITRTARASILLLVGIARNSFFYLSITSTYGREGDDMHEHENGNEDDTISRRYMDDISRRYLTWWADTLAREEVTIDTYDVGDQMAAVVTDSGVPIRGRWAAT